MLGLFRITTCSHPASAFAISWLILVIISDTLLSVPPPATSYLYYFKGNPISLFPKNISHHIFLVHGLFWFYLNQLVKLYFAVRKKMFSIWHKMWRKVNYVICLPSLSNSVCCHFSLFFGSSFGGNPDLSKNVKCNFSHTKSKSSTSSSLLKLLETNDIKIRSWLWVILIFFFFSFIFLYEGRFPKLVFKNKKCKWT